MTLMATMVEKDRRVCLECVDEEYPRAQTENHGEEGTCFYCEQHAKTFSLAQIADLTDLVLPSFYRYLPKEEDDVTAPEKVQRRKGQPVAEVIRDMGIAYAAADDIRGVLATRYHAETLDSLGEEGRFDPEAHYLKKRFG